jgi:type III restriction enzyme
VAERSADLHEAEASEAFALDESDLVDAWVKNDQLGFKMLYTFGGR